MAEIARAALASAISVFWRAHKCKYIWNLLNVGEKNRMIRVREDILVLKPFFRIRETFFKFRTKLLSLA